MTSDSEKKLSAVRTNVSTFAKAFGGGLLGCSGGLVLFVWLTSLLFGLDDPRRCEVTNQTERPVDANIWVFGQSFSVSALPPGESFIFDYRPGGEGSYTVQVTFPSGDGYVEHDGYIDSGNATDRILIHETDFELETLLIYKPRPTPTPKP